MRRSRWLPFVLTALVATLVSTACSGTEAEAPSSTTRPAESSVAAETTQPTSEGPLALALERVAGETGTTMVEVRLTNISGETVRVMRPFVTPHFVVFRVIDDQGREIPFDGPYPRLEPLTEADVAVLAAGDTTRALFDLSEHFALPIGVVTVSAEYRARTVHNGGLALTIDPDDPVEAAAIDVVVGP